jgi:hypothetical protein
MVLDRSDTSYETYMANKINPRFVEWLSKQKYDYYIGGTFDDWYISKNREWTWRKITDTYLRPS